MTSHVCLQSTLSDSNIESIGQKCLENTPKFFFLNNLLQIIKYKLYFYCFFRGEKQSWFFLRIAKIADKICLTSISGFDEEMFLYSIQLFILFFYNISIVYTNYLSLNMRQVQPETLPKNSNFSSCLQNIKLKNNTTQNSKLRTVFVSATEYCFIFIWKKKSTRVPA